MIDEPHMRLLNFLLGALGGVSKLKWFLSYGTLLYYIRDFRMEKPYEWDYDVCLFNADAEAVMLSMESSGFHLHKKIVNDVTGEPFQLVYKHNRMEKYADLFFMFDVGGYTWHTYDFDMEMPEDGIPKNYRFKGVPSEYFEGEVFKYMWFDNIPKLPFPCKYGTLLDTWYPGWFIPDSNFGQSRCQRIVETKSCVKLTERLL